MKILFICTAFAPENAIGCIRTTKLAKYLVRQGHDITVISPSIHEGMNTSDSLLCPELYKIDHITVSYSPAFSKIFLKKRNKMTQSGSINELRSYRSGIKKSIYRTAEAVYSFIRNKDWYHQVKKTIRKKRLTGYDFVFSSYPSISSHYGAAYTIKKGIAKKWIADFRDPMVYEMSGRLEQKYDAYVQRRIESAANYITVVSNDVIYKFATDELTLKKIRVLPNGIDFDDYSISMDDCDIGCDSNKLQFCYAGGLYGGKRDLSVFFEVIGDLIKQNTVDKDNIVIHYCGRDFQVFSSQAEKYYMTDIIINHGMIDRREAIQLELMCDCNIVCTHNSHSDRGVVPGKLYECIASNKYVLGIVNGDATESELKRLILSFQAGEVYEEANHAVDRNKLRDAIIELYMEKMSTGNITLPNNMELKQKYDYSTLAKQLITFVSDDLKQEIGD